METKDAKPHYKGQAALDKIKEILQAPNTIYPLAYIVRSRTGNMMMFGSREEAEKMIFPIPGAENMKISAYKKGKNPFIEIHYFRKTA